MGKLHDESLVAFKVDSKCRRNSDIRRKCEAWETATSSAVAKVSAGRKVQKLNLLAVQKQPALNV